jgi:hypothetical protein
MLKNFNKNFQNNRNISIFTSISYHSVFTRPPFLFFQHNQQCDTLLPIVPCTHKLKAGIACSCKKKLYINNFASFNIVFYQIFQEGHTDKCLLEPLNIDKTIAIDLFIFNWTLGENMLGSIEVVKCGKILPIIEAPLAKQVKISTQKEDCIKIETLPLSVYRKSNNIVGLNGTVSWIS